MPKEPTAYIIPRCGFRRAADGVIVCKEKSNFVDKKIYTTCLLVLSRVYVYVQDKMPIKFPNVTL